jgi:ATP synthase protein I
MNRKAQQGGSAGGGDGRDDPDREGQGLEARLRQLEANLAARRPKPEPADDKRAATGYAQAVKLSSEFIAAVAVGFAIGYGLDRFVGTKPWGMIIFLLLGFCAGVLNVMRSAGVVARPTLPERGEGRNKTDRRDGG